MKEIEALGSTMLHIGHTGENEAVRASFSLLPFKEAFPDGTPALLVRRKGDAEAYPVTLTVEGDMAYWTVTSADTEKAGFGQCELQWYVGQTLAKSDKFDFLVAQALEAGAEPPDAPSKRWFEALEEKIGDLSKLTTKAKENLVAAINEAAKTGSGGAGSIEMQVSGGYIQYSTDGGETWENLIATADLKGADGAPGQDGYSPSASVSQINGGARIVITDKSGTTGVTVMNGTQGQKGDTPVITAEKSGKVTAIKADGVTIATVNDGKDGAPGAKGDTGATPDIQIGTVTTLDAGADASASMGGTAESPLLNLGIPKGADGGGPAQPELLLDLTLESAAAITTNIDFGNHNRIVLTVGGEKGEAAITMPKGDLYMGGYTFRIAYYSAFLHATNEAYPAGGVVYCIERLAADVIQVDFAQSPISDTLLENNMQMNSSKSLALKTQYGKGSVTDKQDGIDLSFSTTVNNVKCRVFGV